MSHDWGMCTKGNHNLFLVGSRSLKGFRLPILSMESYPLILIVWMLAAKFDVDVVCSFDRGLSKTLFVQTERFVQTKMVLCLG